MLTHSIRISFFLCILILPTFLCLGQISLHRAALPVAIMSDDYKLLDNAKEREVENGVEEEYGDEDSSRRARSSRRKQPSYFQDMLIYRPKWAGITTAPNTVKYLAILTGLTLASLLGLLFYTFYWMPLQIQEALSVAEHKASGDGWVKPEGFRIVAIIFCMICQRSMCPHPQMLTLSQTDARSLSMSWTATSRRTWSRTVDFSTKSSLQTTPIGKRMKTILISSLLARSCTPKRSCHTAAAGITMYGTIWPRTKTPCTSRSMTTWYVSMPLLQRFFADVKYRSTSTMMPSLDWSTRSWHIPKRTPSVLTSSTLL